MKIKITDKSYEEVINKPQSKRKKPKKQTAFWRNIMYIASKAELKAIDFSFEEKNMEGIDKDTPCLYLMNHSSFTDLQIASLLLRDKQYHIVCTNDGFVGKEGLMMSIGCIPAKKFIADVNLVKDMKYAIDKLGSSVLMFPEASYSFDGTTTPLPESIAKCVKLLNVPVVMIRTKGAFLRDPLYNCLQKRNVKVSATVEKVIAKEDIKALSPKEINDILNKAFEYDHFREQHEAGIVVDETFRADGLNRALYKCPGCSKEGRMVGKGISIKCLECDSEYELTETGKLRELQSPDGKTGRTFEFVSDWYAWQREEVKKEILSGDYVMDYDVDILMLSDMESIYRIGEGHLHHDKDGFVLTGCDGKLNYRQNPKSSYSLYADYFWYEQGDMISIGDGQYQYYCFPKDQANAVVAKARLATEELFKLE